MELNISVFLLSDATLEMFLRLKQKSIAKPQTNMAYDNRNH